MDQHGHHHQQQQQQQQGAPRARLCHIVKWDDFDGYGFNLHAEKGKSGQFVGKVDEGSPSEAAGLRQGDRIVEVNEIGIASESHKQVVERIKAFPAETKLLVVDRRADDYFRANGVPIRGGMPGVEVIKTPERAAAAATAAVAAPPTENGGGQQQQQQQQQQRSNCKQGAASGGGSDTHSICSSSDGGHSNQETASNGNGSRLDDDNASTKSSSSAGTTTTATAGAGAGGGVLRDQQQLNGAGGGDGGGSSSGSGIGSAESTLDLGMSAKELRAKLAMRKKYDPKKESLGFKDKFDIVQKL